ncbi:MAG: hypothetical protein RMK29_11060 [Myxococcales bacterium]|nr:hypothetical protein [Myxococcota bacterium]MDW8282245.1 hypothetical protein [Myxococcales bacterium]
MSMLRAVFLAVPLWSACTTPPAGAERPPGKDSRMDTQGTITIAETTVGQVAGCRIGVSNIWTEEFTGEDGRRQRAPRASLTIVGCPGGGTELRVHQGQKIQIGTQWFLVQQVRETPNNRGSVTLLPQRGK